MSTSTTTTESTTSESTARTKRRPWWRTSEMIALGASGVLLVAGLAVEWTTEAEGIALALFWATIAIGGAYPLRSAVRAIRRRRLTITVLLVVAAIGAIALGLVEEAAALVVIFSLGEAMEAYATDKARGSITALMDLTPASANRLTSSGATDLVDAKELHPGDVVVIRPGERLPTDGTIVHGQSWIDASPVTGESIPVEASHGTEAFGGSLNGNGVLHLEVTKEYHDTVLARVIDEVEEAQANRSGAERFADRFGAIYTPAMFVLAIAVSLVLPFLGFPWEEAIYRGLVVLVVSCSCALVISVPVSVVTAIARGARDGILIKGGVYLERLADIRAVAFDKTGTLTRGRPALTQVVSLTSLTEDQALALAAGVEFGSEHPIATAIVTGARERELAIPPATGATALPGSGMEATVAGRSLTIGRPAGADRADPTVGPVIATAEAAGHTAVVLRDHAAPLAVIAVADQVRADARATIAELRELGIEHVLMLTGDNATVAKATADTLGLDGYRAELLPEDKSAAVRDLRDTYGVIAMVGDGVNDAPALANADLAIGMGAAGTDVALETADVALMADELDRLPAAIRLSRRARRNITINITVSLAVVAVLVVAALGGWMSLTTGLLLNEGSAALIILNGLRMLTPGRGETRHHSGTTLSRVRPLPALPPEPLGRR